MNIINSVALRKTKIVYNFGLCECNRVHSRWESCSDLIFASAIIYLLGKSFNLEIPRLLQCLVKEYFEVVIGIVIYHKFLHVASADNLNEELVNVMLGLLSIICFGYSQQTDLLLLLLLCCFTSTVNI